MALICDRCHIGHINSDNTCQDCGKVFSQSEIKRMMEAENEEVAKNTEPSGVSTLRYKKRESRKLKNPPAAPSVFSVENAVTVSRPVTEPSKKTNNITSQNVLKGNEAPKPAPKDKSITDTPKKDEKKNSSVSGTQNSRLRSMIRNSPGKKNNSDSHKSSSETANNNVEDAIIATDNKDFIEEIEFVNECEVEIEDEELINNIEDDGDEWEDIVFPIYDEITDTEFESELSDNIPGNNEDNTDIEEKKYIERRSAITEHKDKNYDYDNTPGDECIAIDKNKHQDNDSISAPASNNLLDNDMEFAGNSGTKKNGSNKQPKSESPNIEKKFSPAELVRQRYAMSKAREIEKKEGNLDFDFNHDGFYDDIPVIDDSEPSYINKMDILKGIGFVIGMILFTIFLIYYF